MEQITVTVKIQIITSETDRVLLNNTMAVYRVQDKPKYKTTKINNRRYLGNKYKLIPFIENIVESECVNINTFADE